MNKENNISESFAFISKDNIYYKRKDKEAIIIGILLFFLNGFVLIKPAKGEYVIFGTFAIILTLARVPIALWCSTIAKRKNRHNTGWSLLGFFFPAITLIIIGNLKKSDEPNIEELQIDQVNLSVSEKNNINNLPLVTLPSPTVLIIDALSNDNLTLKYMINNYKRYVKENGALFPLYAAVELNRRGEKFEKEILTSLNNYSKDKGFQSFYENLEYFKTNE